MMQENEGKGTRETKEERQVELQLGGRHLTLAVVGLALFGVVLFLAGRWTERVARPESPPPEGVQESALPDARKLPDPAQPRELTFYETLGKKASPGFQERRPSPDRKEAPAVLPDAPVRVPPKAPSSTAVKGSSPAPSGRPAGASASPSRAPEERFRVQIASTRNRDAARELAERLRKKGYAARVESVRSAGGEILYKVRVGNYSERAHAEAEAARIRSREKVGAWIVKVQG